EAGEHPRQTPDLLEREDRGAGQPDVFGLRHAVAAPHVAAVGDRDAQAAERPPEPIEDGKRGAHSGPTTAGRPCGSTHSADPSARSSFFHTGRRFFTASMT